MEPTIEPEDPKKGHDNKSDQPIDLSAPLAEQLAIWMDKVEAIGDALQQHVHLAGILSSELIHDATEKIPGKTEAEYRMLACYAGGVGMHLGDATMCMEAAWRLIKQFHSACVAEGPLLKGDPSEPSKTVAEQLKELGLNLE